MTLLFFAHPYVKYLAGLMNAPIVQVARPAKDEAQQC